MKINIISVLLLIFWLSLCLIFALLPIDSRAGYPIAAMDTSAQIMTPYELNSGVYGQESYQRRIYLDSMRRQYQQQQWQQQELNNELHRLNETIYNINHKQR